MHDPIDTHFEEPEGYLIDADFPYISEEEVVRLWKTIKTNSGLSEEEAWHVIMACMVLDMAFARSQHTTKQTEH